MKRTVITIVGVTAALSLAACGPTTAGSSSDDEPRGTNTSSDYEREAIEDEADVDTAEGAPAVDEPVSMLVELGEDFVWEDGTTASVSEPTTYTPSEWAAGGEGYDSHVSFKVTVTNGSDVPLDASFTSPTVQSGEREGDEIYDDEMGGSPDSSILPGRTVTFTVAYGVDDPSDLIVEFSPTWDHDAAYWTTDGE